MPEQKRVPIKDWLETAPAAIKGCINDGDLLDEETGKCITDAFCPYRVANAKCRKHTQKSTGETQVLLAVPASATIDDCANNSQQFYLGGICRAVEGICKFKTQTTFKIATKDPKISPSQKYAKCMKYYPAVRCAGGTKWMFFNGVCLATGFLECIHQFKQISTPVDEENGRVLAYCGKFNKFEI